MDGCCATPSVVKSNKKFRVRVSFKCNLAIAGITKKSKKGERLISPQLETHMIIPLLKALRFIFATRGYGPFCIAIIYFSARNLLFIAHFHCAMAMFFCAYPGNR